jgi:hypothetical protein
MHCAMNDEKSFIVLCCNCKHIKNEMKWCDRNEILRLLYANVIRAIRWIRKTKQRKCAIRNTRFKWIIQRIQRNVMMKMQNDDISNDSNNAMRMIQRNREKMINRRKSLLTTHFREYVKKSYANDELNIYVESIDEYLFHVVIDMRYIFKNNEMRNYRNVDSFVIRFKSYSHDEFDELSRIYAWFTNCVFHIQIECETRCLQIANITTKWCDRNERNENSSYASS